MKIQIEHETFNLSDHFAKQVPWAATLALTRTAKDAQQHIVNDLPKRFTLKNGWTARMIKVVPATKATLEAAVTAPDYMAKQEYGGVQKPADGGKHLAAPGSTLRGKLIRRNQRPRAALDMPNTFKYRLHSGDYAIARRIGRGGRKLRILYWLTPTQKYDPIFDMQGQVQDVVRMRFTRHFMAALKASA